MTEKELDKMIRNLEIRTSSSPKKSEEELNRMTITCADNVSGSPFICVGDNPETWNKTITGCGVPNTPAGTAVIEEKRDMEPVMIEGEQKKVEKVNHPSHYNSKGKETIEVLKDYLSDEEYAGFLKGNILKYIHRYEYKAGLEDLEKAKWYLEELIRRNTK